MSDTDNSSDGVVLSCGHAVSWGGNGTVGVGGCGDASKRIVGLFAIDVSLRINEPCLLWPAQTIEIHELVDPGVRSGVLQLLFFHRRWVGVIRCYLAAVRIGDTCQSSDIVIAISRFLAVGVCGRSQRSRIEVIIHGGALIEAITALGQEPAPERSGSGVLVRCLMLAGIRGLLHEPCVKVGIGRRQISVAYRSQAI